MLAGILEVYQRSGGVDAALRVARDRRTTHFAPRLVDAFCVRATDIFDDLDGRDQAGSWDAVIESEPGLRRWLSAEELDSALEALADYTDLKSPFLLGHSRGVTELAAAAGGVLGLGAPDVALLRRGPARVPDTST